MKSRQIKARVKARLLSGKSITVLEAVNRWNTTKLPEYIRRLRKDYTINCKMVLSKDKQTRYGIYSLAK